jgi:hypothetical protein
VPHPVDPELLALRVGLISAQEGWCPEYSRTTFHDWFINHHAPGVADHVERVLTSLEKPTPPIIARAKSHEAESLMKEAIDEARSIGIFGAPTFAIGHEIFWVTIDWKMRLNLRRSTEPKSVLPKAPSMILAARSSLFGNSARRCLVADRLGRSGRAPSENLVQTLPACANEVIE